MKPTRALLMALLLAPLAAVCAADAKPAKRPNIVYLFTDQQPWYQWGLRSRSSAGWNSIRTLEGLAAFHHSGGQERRISWWLSASSQRQERHGRYPGEPFQGRWRYLGGTGARVRSSTSGRARSSLPTPIPSSTAPGTGRDLVLRHALPHGVRAIARNPNWSVLSPPTAGDPWTPVEMAMQYTGPLILNAGL